MKKIDCREKALEKIFNELKEPVQAVVEAASNGYWFSYWCTRQGIQLTLSHSKMLKAIRQLSHIEALLKDQLPVEAMLEVSVDREQNHLTQEQIQRIEDGIEKAVWFNESAQRLREVPGSILAGFLIQRSNPFCSLFLQ